MLLFIDNYDSFTYNLVQYFGELGATIHIVEHDKISLREAETLQPDYLCISPGPGNPQEAGISCSIIRHFAGKIPILGVCLGHQCIAEVFGGAVVQASHQLHGKTSLIYHNRPFLVGSTRASEPKASTEMTPYFKAAITFQKNSQDLFKNLPNPFLATRYHSLIVEQKTFPDCLEIRATTAEGEIMGLRHRDLPIWGVQFHPESILTTHGKELLKNFLDFKPKNGDGNGKYGIRTCSKKDF